MQLFVRHLDGQTLAVDVKVAAACVGGRGCCGRQHSRLSHLFVFLACASPTLVCRRDASLTGLMTHPFAGWRHCDRCSRCVGDAHRASGLKPPAPRCVVPCSSANEPRYHFTPFFKVSCTSTCSSQGTKHVSEDGILGGGGRRCSQQTAWQRARPTALGVVVCIVPPHQASMGAFSLRTHPSRHAVAIGA